VTKILLKDIIKKHKVDIVPPKEPGISVPVPEKTVPEKGLPVKDAIPPLKVPDKTTVQELPHLKDAVSLKVPGKATGEEAPRVKDAISLKVPERERFEIDDSPIPPKTVTTREKTPPDRTAYPHEALSSMATTMLPEINRSLAALRETLTTLSSDIRESGRRQAEMVRLLEEISASMARDKKRRRWFHSTSL